MWKWVGWMTFSVILLTVFGVITYRNINEILDAESTTATIVDPPIVSAAGEGEIATAKVRFTTNDGQPVETFVLGVATDASEGDRVEVHYLGSDPLDATVDDPPNRLYGLILSALFTLIGAGGLWSIRQDRPRPDYESHWA